MKKKVLEPKPQESTANGSINSSPDLARELLLTKLVGLPIPMAPNR